MVWLATLPGGCQKPGGDRRDPPAGKREPHAASASLAEVSAHTSGAISVASPIRVAFSRNVSKVIGPVAGQPVRFEPAIAGQAAFVRKDELVFTPSRPLPPGQGYRATVDLASLTSQSSTPFTFSFTTLAQSFTLSVDDISFGAGEQRRSARIAGAVNTEDVADGKAVENGFSLNQARAQVSWRHAPDRKSHHFVIEGLGRKDDDQNVEIVFDGQSIGVAESKKVTQTLPGLNNFTVLSARAVQEGGRHIELQFSDDLKAQQKLQGLVTIEGVRTRLVVRGNVVEVHGRTALPNAVEVVVSPGIRNDLDMKLRSGGRYRVEFERLKPQVRFVGSGTIYPTSQNLTVPIETANLRRVTVEALRVSGDNLPQFFQVNRHDGQNELKRVGRVVWKRTLALDGAGALEGAWTRHGLDIGPLVKQERAGMIRLRLSFGIDDILFNCARADAAAVQVPALEGDDELGNANDEAESSYWDTVTGNYYDMYANRDNPCHPGYYRNHAYYGSEGNNVSAFSSRNVVISDLGIMAKTGAGAETLVVVTDLRTARPRAGALVKLVDYQQQIIASGRTDSAGQVRLGGDRAPFLVVAEHQEDTGFLRLDHGDALNTAHFDTAGASLDRGLKGYFYGERGIWRPGDAIHLTFVLFDRDGNLPKDHPLHLHFSDPQGKLVRRLVRPRAPDGFHVFALGTARDAPTGNYTAQVKVGGATFTEVVRVEAIRPNRLKIGLDSKHAVLRPESPIDGTLSAQWLHGATAAGLQARIEVRLHEAKTTFPAYGEYRFDDPTRGFDAAAEEIWSGTLDAEGRAKVDDFVPFEGPAPGMLEAAFTSRVFEEGGGFSVDRHTLRFSPYQRYLGLRLPPGDKTRGMLLTDTRHEARVVLLDAAGKKIGGKTRVKLALYKVSWRWWWEKGPDDLAAHASGESMTALAQGEVTLQDGEAVWPFEIKYPDWGRYLILASDEQGGHRTGWVFYCDWPGWAGRAGKDQPGGAKVLAAVTDKSVYELGEDVTLTIPAAVAGRALVSIENGSRVLSASWVEMKGKPVQHRFKASADMAPNVYAHVTLLQPHEGRGNDLPLRLYGITPIRVVDPKTRLEPVVKAPAAFEPGGSARVAVSEASGRAMTYTLAIVDEGLLGLTRHKTPNPWNTFYAREALGVKSWDLFDEVVNGQGARPAHLLAIGGGDEGEGDDDDGESPEAQKRVDRFPPMVIFAGPFALEAGESREHAFALPPYVGAVRVMVVAGQGNAFGAAEQSVYVRKPLVVLGDLPRVLGPGEEVTLPVATFALEKHIRKVEVAIAGGPRLEVVGKAKKSVSFSAPGDEIVSFGLKAGPQLGAARVTISARDSGGKETATHEIAIEVRHPGAPVTTSIGRRLEAGETWSLDELPLPGMPGSNSAVLEVSRMPPLDLARQLGYLVRYPHGCVEQVTSAAFPQVYLSRLMELDDSRASAVDNHVNAAIERLQRHQNPDGGFGYWPIDRESHDFATSWVGHFLLEAQRAGYAVPPRMLKAWIEHQQEVARRPLDGAPDLISAYRLYTLANAGKPELGAMNRLRESDGLSDAARFRLAAAYQLAGQKQAAQALIAAAPVAIENVGERHLTFSSPLREQAMVLETLVMLDDARAGPLAAQVSEALATDARHNTQATAFALVAMSRWAQQPAAAGAVAFSGRMGAQPFTGKSNRLLVQIPVPLPGGGGHPIPFAIENRGASGFARLIFTGLPAVGSEKASSRGLDLKVAYERMDGGALDPGKIAQGTDFKIKVTVAGKGRLSELALTHILPSGVELRSERLTAGQLRGARLDYQDIRDDRVLTYFDLADAPVTVEVLAHAAYPGRYYLPPVHVEAMYEPTIQAHTRGQWITITPSGHGS